jgi:hypothetical protein
MTREFNKEYAMKKTNRRSHLCQKVGVTCCHSPRSGERSYRTLKNPGWVLLVTVTLCNFVFGQPEHDYPLAPMSFEKVTLQDNFWLPRLRLQAESTVPHALKQTEPAVENLRRCGNFLHGRGGLLFNAFEVRERSEADDFRSA